MEFMVEILSQTRLNLRFLIAFQADSVGSIPIIRSTRLSLDVCSRSGSFFCFTTLPAALILPLITWRTHTSSRPYIETVKYLFCCLLTPGWDWTHLSSGIGFCFNLESSDFIHMLKLWFYFCATVFLSSTLIIIISQKTS